MQKIIALSGRQPDLLFRLADLWLEESRARSELLFDLSDFTRAAAEYRLVVERDVECGKSGQCAPGRFMEAAALGEINAREAIIAASLPHQGALNGGEVIIAYAE